MILLRLSWRVHAVCGGVRNDRGLGVIYIVGGVCPINRPIAPAVIVVLLLHEHRPTTIRMFAYRGEAIQTVVGIPVLRVRIIVDVPIDRDPALRSQHVAIVVRATVSSIPDAVAGVGV